MDSKLFNVIGELVAYGGGTFAICYLALRILGLRWLDEKFKKRLLDFEQQQKLDFQHYQFEINKLFNRVNKVQGKEFEVLPKAWEKLQIAYGMVRDMASPLQHYPDLNRMSSPELDEFLKNTELFAFQKKELLESSNKLNYYIEKVFWFRHKKVADSIVEFHNYIILNKIFFRKDMFDLFSDIDGRLGEANLTSYYIGAGSGYDHDHGGELSRRIEALQPIINNLETLIQKRLHFEEAG